MFRPLIKGLLWLTLILADLAVYIALGLLMMGYDDIYDSSKGEYWRWERMNSTEQMITVAMQFWNVLNVVLVCILAYKLIRKFYAKGRPDAGHGDS